MKITSTVIVLLLAIFISHNAEGQLISVDTLQIDWVSEYSSQALQGQNFATASTLDDSGNVYVVGASQWGGSEYDFMIIKYSPDGDIIWKTRYGGPVSGRDIPSSIIYTSGGDIVVSGISKGLNNATEITIIKYDSDGNELWVNRYGNRSNSFSTITDFLADSSDNLYIVTNNRIRKVSSSGTITTVAGTSPGGFSGDDD